MAKKQDTSKKQPPADQKTAGEHRHEPWPRDEEQEFAIALSDQEELLETAAGKPGRRRGRQTNLDFFECNILDVATKGDIWSMEHPFYAMRAGDTATRRYTHNDVDIEIIPSSLGMATQRDKDVLLYCAAQITEKINRGEPVEARVSIRMHSLLLATNRPTSGVGYKRLEAALKRLQGTQVWTNIKTGGKHHKSSFNLIERCDSADDGWLHITLPEWFFRAIAAREVLTYHPDYFLLNKPIEQKLYELARKHCGGQRSWRCSLELLLKKSGSVCRKKEFKRALEQVVESQHLPQYDLVIDGDAAVFTNRSLELTAADNAECERLAQEAVFREEWERDHPGQTWPGYQRAFVGLRPKA